MHKQLVLPNIEYIFDHSIKCYHILSRTKTNKILSYFVYIDEYDNLHITRLPYAISFDDLIKSRIIKLIIREYFINIPSKDYKIYRVKVCILSPEYECKINKSLFVTRYYYLKHYDPFGYQVFNNTCKLLYPRY